MEISQYECIKTIWAGLVLISLPWLMFESKYD